MGWSLRMIAKSVGSVYGEWGVGVGDCVDQSLSHPKQGIRLYGGAESRKKTHVLPGSLI
jgi:hypothetical protein